MVEVKAFGEMYVDGGKKGFVLEEYKETFLLHDDFAGGNNPNMVVQKMLINGRLRQKNKEFRKVKTCDAKTFVNSSDKKVKILDKEELYNLDMQELREYSAILGLLFKGSILGRPDEIRKKVWEKTASQVVKKEKALESNLDSHGEPEEIINAEL